jgi:hypothetical protein
VFGTAPPRRFLYRTNYKPTPDSRENFYQPQKPSAYPSYLGCTFDKRMRTLSAKEPLYGECQMHGLRPTRYIAFSLQSTSNATEKPNRVPLGGRTRVRGGGQTAIHEENSTSSTTSGCERGAACAGKADVRQEVTSYLRSSTGIGFSDLSVAYGPGERTHQSRRFPKARPNSAVVTTRHRGRCDTRLVNKACKHVSFYVAWFTGRPHETECIPLCQDI